MTVFTVVSMMVVGAGCSADVSAEGKAAPKPAPATKAAANGAFKAGDRVDAVWTDDVYYEAKVAKANADGTYAVDFDDGSQLLRAKPIKLRAPVPHSPKLGDHVEAVWSGGGFYTAKVTKVNADGTFDVVFDDDGTEGRAVAPAKIRAYVEPVWKAGDPVWGKFTDSLWYPAKVTGVNKDGTVKVVYSADNAADTLPRGKLRSRDPATTPKAAPASTSAPESGGNCAGPGMPRRCNGVCTTIQDNDNNCGACGNQCKSGYHCQNLFCRDAAGNL